MSWRGMVKDALTFVGFHAGGVLGSWIMDQNVSTTEWLFAAIFAAAMTASRAAREAHHG